MTALALIVSLLATPASVGGTPDCSLDGAPYYAVDLVPTHNLPGLARAGGTGELAYAYSPFSIAVTEGGHYRYDLVVRAEGLPRRDDGAYVAWVTTPDLDEIVRVGGLDDDLNAAGQVTFNKFLIVVTFEPTDSNSRTWKGPIVLRGMSRSGLMHTMAGHGPFSSEPCATYGY